MGKMLGKVKKYQNVWLEEMSMVGLSENILNIHFHTVVSKRA